MKRPERLKPKKCIHKKGMDPKFVRNQKFAKKKNNIRYPGLTLYIKKTNTSNLPSVHMLSIAMYCYLKYSCTPFRIRYTTRDPYMAILDRYYQVDEVNLFDQLREVGKDFDEPVRQHNQFISFEQEMKGYLKRLELAQLYYLYKKFPSFGWAIEKFTRIEEELQIRLLKEEEIEDLGKNTCFSVSNILKDNVNLFRVLIEEGQWSVTQDITIVKEEIGKAVRTYWDFNPCTTLDVSLTRILLVIKLLVDTPIYKEFVKYPNLFAYVERFFVKFVKIEDAVDLSTRRGSYDFVEGLIKQSDQTGEGSYGKVYVCKFPQRNPLDLPAGRYAVKTVKELGFFTYYGEMIYLRSLRYDFTPKLFGYGSDNRSRHYFIMQYHSAGSLDKKIGELEYRHALNILIDVCNGLHSIHTHTTSTRLLHDDLNPRNILLTEAGRAKVIDFGCLSTVGCEVMTHGSIYRERKVAKGGGAKAASRFASQSRDIFSFGITMLKVFTSEEIQINMATEIELKQKLEGGVAHLTLIREEIRNSGCDDRRAQEIIDLALSCIQTPRELFPSAHVVSYRLMQIRDSV